MLGVILRAEIESVDSPLVPPLVKSRRGLVVLETTQDGAVYDYLVIVQLSANDAEGAMQSVLINVYLGQSRRRSGGHPFFTLLVI